MKIAIILFVGATAAFANTTPSRGRSECEINPGFCRWNNDRPVSAAAPVQVPASAPTKTIQDKLKSSTAKAVAIPATPSGNLPAYLSNEPRRPGNTDGFVIIAEKQTGAALSGLRAGDILEAELEQSIKASPSVPTPIRARVTAGRFAGAFILGVAVFDKELKRILLSFERLRLPSSDVTYTLKATGLAPSGQVGLEGDHHTQEGTYFAGEILAASAAGYADAVTQRNQTAFGTYQTEPSVANAAKQGAVNALSKTADRFAEQSRSAPEYTEIEAGRAVRVLIQESPMEANGS